MCAGCKANHYKSGKKCVACPDGLTKYLIYIICPLLLLCFFPLLKYLIGGAHNHCLSPLHPSSAGAGQVDEYHLCTLQWGTIEHPPTSTHLLAQLVKLSDLAGIAGICKSQRHLVDSLSIGQFLIDYS